MNTMKKRWIVLLASVIINICIGTGFAWSVYQSALMTESVSIFGMQVEASQLALAFTICSAVAPIPMIAGGGLQKKFGPKLVICGGGIMFGAGLILSSFVSSLIGLYMTYGLLCGFGIAFAYGITIGNTGAFFPEKRGLIAGITTAAYGAGSIIFPPIMQSMITSGGVQNTMLILGIAYAVVVVVAAQFVSAPPEGWKPDGWNPPAPKAGAPKLNKNWKEMLKDVRFYLMIAAFTIFATGGLMVVSQGKPMAEAMGGVDAVTAATAVSIIALANTGGRVIWGFVSDKIGRYPALVAMSVVVAAGGFLLSTVTNSYIMFLVCAMLIAMCYGGSMGVYPALTADNFGPKHNGVNYGIIFIGFALGGYIGPVLATSLFKSAGSYSTPAMVVGILGVVALALVLGLIMVRKSAAKKADAKAEKEAKA